MSPSILLVPVDPCPPQEALDALAARLERTFGWTVGVTGPVTPPAAARLDAGACAAEPIRAAVAATWGCGCRDRLVGVTSAEVVGAGETGPACGDVLVVSLPGDRLASTLARSVGGHLGLGDCQDLRCVMHPAGGATDLCPACRARC